MYTRMMTYDEIMIAIYIIIAMIMVGAAAYYIYKSFFCGYKFIVKMKDPNYVLIVEMRALKYPLCKADKIQVHGTLVFVQQWMTYKYSAQYFLSNKISHEDREKEIAKMVQAAVEYVEQHAKFDHKIQ